MSDTFLSHNVSSEFEYRNINQSFSLYIIENPHNIYVLNFIFSLTSLIESEVVMTPFYNLSSHEV